VKSVLHSLRLVSQPCEWLCLLLDSVCFSMVFGGTVSHHTAFLWCWAIGRRLKLCRAVYERFIGKADTSNTFGSFWLQNDCWWRHGEVIGVCSTSGGSVNVIALRPAIG